MKSVNIGAGKVPESAFRDASDARECQAVPADPRKLEEELDALDARRLQLDAAIRDAQNRQRYGRDPGTVDGARAEEATLVRDLDHLMTRYRAVEGRLLLAQSGQKTFW